MEEVVVAEVAAEAVQVVPVAEDPAQDQAVHRFMVAIIVPTMTDEVDIILTIQPTGTLEQREV